MIIIINIAQKVLFCKLVKVLDVINKVYCALCSFCPCHCHIKKKWMIIFLMLDIITNSLLSCVSCID
jgi:hypothetical protein